MRVCHILWCGRQVPSAGLVIPSPDNLLYSSMSFSGLYPTWKVDKMFKSCYSGSLIRTCIFQKWKDRPDSFDISIMLIYGCVRHRMSSNMSTLSLDQVDMDGVLSLLTLANHYSICKEKLIELFEHPEKIMKFPNKVKVKEDMALQSVFHLIDENKHATYNMINCHNHVNSGMSQNELQPYRRPVGHFQTCTHFPGPGLWPVLLTVRFTITTLACQPCNALGSLCLLLLLPCTIFQTWY